MGGKDVVIQGDDQAIFNYIVDHTKRGEIDTLKVYKVGRQKRGFENPHDSLSSSTKELFSILLPTRVLPKINIVSSSLCMIK